jgi:hypothetical protein
MTIDGRRRDVAGVQLQPLASTRVRFLPILANTETNASIRAPKRKQRKGRNQAMFAFIAKRQKSNYREAMRQLQPFANEASSLWLSGHYRGVNLLVPDFSGTRPSHRNDRRGN